MEAGGAKPESREGGEGEGRYRLLVVASEPLSGQDLAQEIRAHSGGREPRVRVVFPAFTHSRLRQVMGDVDAGIREAKGKLDRELEEARSRGLEIEGAIGDSDPVTAIEDALLTFPADEILVVTHDEEHADWAERELFDRAKERFDPPLTHAIVRGEAGGVEDVEHAGRGRQAAISAAAASREYIPMARRDILGIVVAIAGSIIAVLISIDCPGRIEAGTGTSAGCIAELILAGGIALINAAHIVALLLISGAPYPSRLERVIATFSLIGTPVVIVTNLIISAAAG